MAQPLFDQHPLEEYFRHTGETAEPMPGSSPDFATEDDSIDISPDEELLLSLPPVLESIVMIVQELLQSSTSASDQHSFVERFKYDVISSSLLSSTLAASLAVPSAATRRTRTPDVPGRLAHASDDDDDPSTSHVASATPSSPSPVLPVALLSIAVVVLSAGYYPLAFLLLAAAIYVRYVTHPDVDKGNYTTQTMDALNDLISAGNVWDSAVNEAIMLIENEERSIFYGPTSSQAPLSSLRVALQSSLHTTQTQCDNVRQLFSALTSPTTLSQLAEMYAPPSPIRPGFSVSDSQRSPSSPSASLRPFSHPTGSWRQRTTSLPDSQSPDKRATWNGSYASLAMAGSPTAHLLARKKQNRRSDVTSLFQPLAPGSSLTASISAPVSPNLPSPEPRNQLDVLQEEDHFEDDLEDKNYFGAAALDMQRKRKSVALETFGLPPPSYTPPRSTGRGEGGSTSSIHSPTISSSSRLTPLHTTRHPLSLSGLHLALQAALSSKRYACSYLLALRFDEDEDDTYWENVRSVMALLTSTFSDASARLIEALDDSEKKRVKDEHPTPPRGNTPTPNGKAVGESRRGGSPLRHSSVPSAAAIALRSVAEMVSFAPMPSNMARFASHVDAVSTALNDAREHIEECIAALRDPQPQLVHQADSPDAPVPSVQDHPAFQAYDRLRKELGYALRECERGRERLLEIVAPRLPPDAAEDEDMNTPGLRQDSGSESSEKGPVSPNGPNTGTHDSTGLGLSLSLGRQDGDEREPDVDDATAHLLLSSSVAHLPPAGVEQVYEADTGAAGAFARPRSKLSREERIAIMKARRTSGMLFTAAATGSAVPSPLASPISDVGRMDRHGHERERWGPGGEVVQELKDVIWKVGEKRRRMSQLPPQPQPPRTPTGEPAQLPPEPHTPLEGVRSEDVAVEPAVAVALGADDVSLAYLEEADPAEEPLRADDSVDDVFRIDLSRRTDLTQERESSILIAVDGGSPENEIDDPTLELGDSSPPASPLPYTRRVLELEAALRRHSQPPPASVLHFDEEGEQDRSVESS